MYHRQGLGIDPATISLAVQTGVSALTKILPFVGGTEIPYDDFSREIAPIILPKAKATGRPVFVCWYGEVIGLAPDGQFLNVGTYTTIDEGIQIIQGIADQYGTVYGYLYDQFREFAPTAGTPGANAPAQPPPGVTIPKLPPGYVTPTKTTVNGGTDYMPYLIAGGVGLLLWKGLKRGK